MQTNFPLNVSLVRSECALNSPGSPNALQLLAHSIFVPIRTGDLSSKNRSCRLHFGVFESKTIEVFSRVGQDTAGRDAAQISAMREGEE